MTGDYELLDLDDGRKLERFGAAVVVRPAPAARGPRRRADAWQTAIAEYARGGDGGAWTIRTPLPEPWLVRSSGLEYVLRATPSGQVGLFPEQGVLRERIARGVGDGNRVLDLFGYTGGSTLAAAAAGAAVTHVDSARGVVRWARENAERNGLAEAPIRWIVDDVPRFVAREVRRGAAYDAIVLDPPSFGRGPKGEVWKIEKDLDALLADCRRLLSARPLFVLLTAHTESWSARSLAARLGGAFRDRPGTTESGLLELRTRSGAVLPSGLFARRVFHG